MFLINHDFFFFFFFFFFFVSNKKEMQLKKVVSIHFPFFLRLLLMKYAFSSVI